MSSTTQAHQAACPMSGSAKSGPPSTCPYPATRVRNSSGKETMTSQWAALMKGRPLKAVWPTSAPSVSARRRPTGRRRSGAVARPTAIRAPIVQQARAKTAIPIVVAMTTMTTQAICTALIGAGFLRSPKAKAEALGGGRRRPGGSPARHTVGASLQPTCGSEGSWKRQVRRGRGKSVTIGDFSRRGRWPRAKPDPRRSTLTWEDAVVPSVRRPPANGARAGKVANRDTGPQKSVPTPLWGRHGVLRR